MGSSRGGCHSHRALTYASGVAEMATGAAVWKDARIGGWSALMVFIGVYPANIKDAVDNWPPGDPLEESGR